MKTVLILDDEEVILKLIAVYLRRSGYSAMQARTADYARKQFTKVDGAVDLLVTDLYLESSSGVEIALNLQQWNPDLKIILMSGYSLSNWPVRDAVLLQELVGASWRVIQKPFAASDLMKVVRELIEAPVALKALRKGIHRHRRPSPSTAVF